MTADELNTIQADLEILLKPYLNRTDPPADSQRVASSRTSYPA